MEKNNKKATQEFGSNFLLNKVEKRLTNKQNKAPAAKFIQRQQRLRKRLKEI
tara:strand:+ start:128 stop:283 length:156 start_codon:yes stop_codon:yes gene_type:complete